VKKDMKFKIKICSCNKKATWKGKPRGDLKRNYSSQKWYFCDECILDCIDGTWSGGGPFGSDFKAFKRLN
jgi:hypothetical protein